MKIDLLSKAQLSLINKNNLKYPLAIAEKDYMLAVILQILYSSSLKDKLIFKGGTAIHHLYLNQLRFSEDLDFTAIDTISAQNVLDVFSLFDFLEIIKFHDSTFALKIERMKYDGPLGQPNSIKIDIDITQQLMRPPVTMFYNNYYRVPVYVQAMAINEICAEKFRAINERARYRDFYDITLVINTHSIKPEEIVSITNKKELRKPLSKSSIMENYEIAFEAIKSGAESIFYKEKLSEGIIKDTIQKLISHL